MSLKQRLIEQITLDGPMTVADYMARCLLDPIDGYYMKQPSLGAEGDFITAPLVSQMFGEMIGVWVAQTWRNLGSPQRFRLVEIGGGDGTLMSDVLRVAAQVPGLRQAAEIVMIEPSPTFRNRQSQAVPEAVFLSRVEDMGDSLPVILFANEVLDCLPARQFVLNDKGWHECRVGLNAGSLAFGLVEAGQDFVPPPHAVSGDVMEKSVAQERFGQTIALLLKACSGAALLIDYGRDQPGPGDTLQALYRHKKHDPLAAPGKHDLTVWADFPAVAAVATHAGVKVSPIVTQGHFLKAMGIDARLAALIARNPDHAGKLQRQYDRLVAPEQMGALFKVLGMAWPTTIALAGVEAPQTEA